MTVPLTELVDPEALARLRALAGTDPEESDVTVPTAAVDADLEEVKADPEVIEHKAAGAAQVLEADEETGLVRAIVSVTGVEDKVKDVIEPGAYTETMKKREPIGVWSHDDKTWVARTEDAKEYFPGDPFFKGLKTMDGEPWPAAAGAVVVDARFNLETPHGAAAFSDVKFFQGKTGWSIGYRATKAFRNIKTGVRRIKALDWFEYSPVMVGAASQPMTLSVKSLSQPVDANDPTGLADDELVDSLTADELGRYKTLVESLGLEFKDRVRTAEGQRRFGQPIGSVIIPDAGPVTDGMLDGMIRSATAKGDHQEVRMLQAAKTMPVAKRRAALEKGTAGNDKPGLSGRLASVRGAETARAVSDAARTPAAPAKPAGPDPSRNSKLADHLMDVQDDLEEDGRTESAREVGQLLDEMINGEHDDDGGAHIRKVLEGISGNTSAAQSIDRALGELGGNNTGRDLSGGKPAAPKADSPNAKIDAAIKEREDRIAALQKLPSYRSSRAGVHDTIRDLNREISKLKAGRKKDDEPGKGNIATTPAERAPHQAAADKLSGDLRAAGVGGPKSDLGSSARDLRDQHHAAGRDVRNRLAADQRGGPATIDKSGSIERLKGHSNDDLKDAASSWDDLADGYDQDGQPRKADRARLLAQEARDELKRRTGGAGGGANKPAKGDQVKVNGRESEVVDVDGDDVDIVDHITGRRRTVKVSDLSDNSDGVYAGPNMEVNGQAVKKPVVGDKVSYSLSGSRHTGEVTHVRGDGQVLIKPDDGGPTAQMPVTSTRKVEGSAGAKEPESIKVGGYTTKKKDIGTSYGPSAAELRKAGAPESWIKLAEEAEGGKAASSGGGAAAPADRQKALDKVRKHFSGQGYSMPALDRVKELQKALDKGDDKEVDRITAEWQGELTGHNYNLGLQHDLEAIRANPRKDAGNADRQRAFEERERARTAGAGRGANPEAARERDQRQARATARDRAGDAAADARIKEREKLAALNKRRRAQGKAPLLKLPENMKALDLAETSDAELEQKALEAWVEGDLDVDEGFEEKRSRASLDTHPNSSNWVEKAGDLPGYIREVARAIHEDHGTPLDHAIPMAIGRIKRWAAGGGNVTAETRAKAAAAVSQWEALKAKAHAKSDADLLVELEFKALGAPVAWADADDGDLAAVLDDFGRLEAVESKGHVGSDDLVDISDLVSAAAELKTWDMLDRAEALKRDF